MKNKSRILVCGGRDFKNQVLFNIVMEAMTPYRSSYFCIIHGHCRGADMMAQDWAVSRGQPFISMPANWDIYPDAAGTVRNKWMLDFGLPDLVIAFPGGNGTADMMRQAMDRGIYVFDVSEHIDEF
jgi:hypothetical protein